jgi:hypothetical protein
LNPLVRTALLAGPVASVYYAAITTLVPRQWPTYDAWSQTISELSAIGAPTRALWGSLAVVYTLLSLVFAWAVLRATAGRRPQSTVGILLLIYAAFGLVWPFAPMHLRETIAAGGATGSDTAHITVGLLTVVLMSVAVGLGTRLWSQRFRLYSGLTLLLVLGAGALTGLQSPGISANRPTPTIGLWERLSLGAFLLWIAVLGLRLRRESASASEPTEANGVVAV